MNEETLYTIIGALVAGVATLYMQLRTLRRKTGVSFLAMATGLKNLSDGTSTAVTTMTTVSKETIRVTQAQLQQHQIAIGALTRALEELGKAVGVTAAAGPPKSPTDRNVN